MIPPVEFRDMSEYKARMNSLLTIDPGSTVVVTVDMQRNYLDWEIAASPVAVDEAERVLRHARDLLDFARSEGIPVVHAYVARRPVEAARGLEITAYGGVSRKAALSQNAQAPAYLEYDRMEGSAQSSVPASLAAPGDIHVTTKKTMDCFIGTDLEILLSRVFKADVVVLTGINTDTCVYSTTFGASNRGFKPVVISDCVASMRGKDHHWMALELMSRSFAWVLTLDQFKEKVRATRSSQKTEQ